MAAQKNRPLTVLGSLLALPLGGYVLVCVVLFLAQESMLFPAPELPQGALATFASRAGAKEVELHAEDGTRLYAWWFDGGGDRAVLYLPGNGESVVSAGSVIGPELQGDGWDVLFLAYRGYPGSDGAPTEAGLTQDVWSAWRFLTEDRGIGANRVVVHGRSLGGGVAGTLLRRASPGAVVLESTFTSMKDRAAEQYPVLPVGALLKHPFLTREVAPTVRAPVLVIHGNEDEVIPVHHGRALARLFPNATYREVSGYGHNDGLLIHDRGTWDVWRAFLEAGVPRR